MSQLGKILLYVALVGALVAVGAGVMVTLQNSTARANLAEIQQAKQADDQAVSQAKKEATTAAEAKQESETKLTTANGKIDDLTAQLTAAQKAATDAATAVQTANDSAKSAKDQLDKINATLGGESADQYKADKAKAESDLAASESEKKILNDQLLAAQTQVNELQDDVNRSKTGTIPPGISGKVTYVNHVWNFVVLNVGLSNGVVPNGELIIYRGRDFLGKVKVTSAEANSAVADILPDIKGDIQVGDYVLN